MSQDIDSVAPSSALQDKRQRNKDEKKKRKRENGEEQTQVERSPLKKSRSHSSHDDQAIAGIGESPSSPFFVTKASFYLPLAPISHFHALAGVCADQLSKLILTYFPPLKGIILSYSNVEISETPQPSAGDKQKQCEPVLAKTIDEFAASFMWVTAEFLLIKAKRGAAVEGLINLQSESHIGLVCWNLFNASIERKRLPKGWKWTGPDPGKHGKARLKKAARGSGKEEEAEDDNMEYGQDPNDHFVDESGKPVEGYVQFRIKDLDTSTSSDKERAFVSIEGTLLSEEEEQELQEQEGFRMSRVHGTRNHTRQDVIMSGAQPDEFS
jgi:DNA-directed RNA polymerase I subunit RPA43